MSLPESLTIEPLCEALDDVRQELARAGVASLPPVQGLGPALVARALYRAAVAGGPWAPWVHLHTRHQPKGGLPWAITPDAWVFVEGPGAEVLARSLPPGSTRAVLWEQPGTARPITEAARVQALQLDELHEVAVDPALAGTRRALLVHCRAAGTVQLAGEPATGRRSLARWAHARCDDRPLSWVHGDQGSHRPGEWALFEEPAELGPEQRAALARVGQGEPSAFSRRWTTGPARPRHPALRAILGHSAALSEVLHELGRVAPTTLPVLITGEPGTGKESLAGAVHALSGREGPFVAIDVGALPEELADSELFGHRRGAFTGADRSRLGAFRAAHGGTLFLDELGNLSPRLQVKLLRVLQERRVQPVGEDAPVPVDVRLVAATNADLSAMVRRGTFRADLLGRLDAATLRLPPLRERVEDLDELARGLLGERAEPWCTPEARVILQSWRWPGNIRELGNVLRYAAAVCPAGQPLAPEHLGPLSPRNRRRVPTLIVSDGATAGWGLEPRQITALTATTLRVPPLRDRGEDALRAAVLRGMGGRPIEPAALDLLARLPWWGNMAELGALFAAIEALPPGPVDRGALVGLVPQVLDATAQAPIFIVLLPDLDEEGRLTGLIREVSAGAALLGRAPSLRALAGPDPRTRAALAAIEALAGPRGVAAVDLSLVPQLSRAHVLVTRSELGLEVHALAGAVLPVSAGSLSEDELHLCVPGKSVPVRGAGEIRVDGRSGEPVLRAWVFLGEVALAEHGATAAARHAAARAALDRTQAAIEPPAASTASTAASGALSTRVWTLTPDEQAALVGLLCAYEGGQLKAHVAEALSGWREDPALRRLARYLDEAPRLSQYLVRLVEHEDNAAVRAELASRLLALPDADTRLDLLPKGLREAVLAAMNA